LQSPDQAVAALLLAGAGGDGSSNFHIILQFAHAPCFLLCEDCSNFASFMHSPSQGMRHDVPVFTLCRGAAHEQLLIPHPALDYLTNFNSTHTKNTRLQQA
jgi:hypothetical protein